jgi:hypothetical protein
MKAQIKKITYKGEKSGQFGVSHNFVIEFDDKFAYYTGKIKEQTFFIEGKECEFELEEKVSKEGKKYFTVKPPKKEWNNSNYAKAVKKEQSRYSGFAVSYVKDLIIADKLKIDQWETASKRIFDFMVTLDKSIETHD